jgi:hypothetical protein
MYLGRADLLTPSITTELEMFAAGQLIHRATVFGGGTLHSPRNLVN